MWQNRVIQAVFWLKTVDNPVDNVEKVQKGIKLLNIILQKYEIEINNYVARLAFQTLYSTMEPTTITDPITDRVETASP